MKHICSYFILFLVLLICHTDLNAADDKSCPALTIVTSSLPAGVIGQPYNVKLLSAGGVSPIIWGLSRVGDPLPKGLTLSPAGLISGTPQAYETKNVVVTAQANCPGARIVARQTLSIRITSPATSDLSLTYLQISFNNGRSETTVKRNQPGLRARADIRFDGSGLLSGYWEVDGRMLSSVNEHLLFGKSVQLTSPEVPFLPTFIEGSHRVRLVITDPPFASSFPEAIYYVTSEESPDGRTQVRVITPRNHAELSFAPQSFSWEEMHQDFIYLVEFFERGARHRVAAAYTKIPGYDLPQSILSDSFSPGKTYLWEIKGYNQEGSLVGTSDPSYFTFSPLN